MSKSTMFAFGGLIVTMSCLLWIFKKSQMSIVNTGVPSLATFIETYTFKAASVVALLSSIGFVLRRRASPQVIFSVIQCIFIYMVNLPPIAWHQILMHVDRTCVKTQRSFCVKLFCNWIVPCSPIPFRKMFKVRSVHNCILQLCQWNKTKVFVDRLSHFMPTQAWFHAFNFKAQTHQIQLVSGG